MCFGYNVRINPLSFVSRPCQELVSALARALIAKATRNPSKKENGPVACRMVDTKGELGLADWYSEVQTQKSVSRLALNYELPVDITVAVWRCGIRGLLVDYDPVLWDV